MAKIYVLLAVLGLAAILPMSAAAELPFTIYGGAGFGKWMEDNAPDGGVGFGAGIIYPFQNSPFAIGADLGYQMLGSYDGVYGLVDEVAEIKLSVIPVTAQGYYMIPVSGSVAPYLGAGVGFYNMRTKVEYKVDLPLLQEFDDTYSSTDMGINLGGGLKFGGADSKMKFGADARFHIIMTEDESTNLVTVFGRIAGAGVPPAPALTPQ